MHGVGGVEQPAVVAGKEEQVKRSGKVGGARQGGGVRGCSLQRVWGTSMQAYGQQLGRHAPPPAISPAPLEAHLKPPCRQLSSSTSSGRSFRREDSTRAHLRSVAKRSAVWQVSG